VAELNEQPSSTVPLTEYLRYINGQSCDKTLKNIVCIDTYSKLVPLFSHVLCTPAISAPVERVFSLSGLIVRPHRARMSDELLETLVFLKCNSKIS
jgi:hypothetical protein